MSTQAEVLALLASGEGADCTIQCRDITLKLHKAHLVPVSSYFAAVFNGHFAESETSTVTIDEDPALLARAVEITYLREYSYSYPTEMLSTTDSGTSQFDQIVDTYADRHPIFLCIDLFNFGDAFPNDAVKATSAKMFAQEWFSAYHTQEQTAATYEFTEIDADVVKAVYDLPFVDNILREMVVIGIQCNMAKYNALGSARLEQTIRANNDLAFDIVAKPVAWTGCRCTFCGCHQPALWEKCECGMYTECESGSCMARLVNKMLCLNCGVAGYDYAERLAGGGVDLSISELGQLALAMQRRRAAMSAKEEKAIFAGTPKMLTIGVASVSPMPSS